MTLDLRSSGALMGLASAATIDHRKWKSIDIEVQIELR
jgi:hypothetical protein